MGCGISAFLVMNYCVQSLYWYIVTMVVYEIIF